MIKKTNNQKITVRINPKVLKWTIESTGWNTEELSKKTKIKSQQILQWQSESSLIELSKLKKSHIISKNPCPYFFFQNPQKKKN